MISKIDKNPQLNLFETPLINLIDLNHELVVLSQMINWEELAKDFEKFYSDFGRPIIPIRKITGSLMLKHIFNQSDEEFVERWKENPYWQYFTGEVNFQKVPPFASSEFSHFRNRVGKEGVEKLLRMSVKLFGKEVNVKEVKKDTTVQEKNITFPTDAKLYKKIIRKCRVIAKKENLTLRQSYVRVVKRLSLDLRFSQHPKRKKKAQAAVRKLRTIAMRLVREIRRLLEEKKMLDYEKKLDLYTRVIHQKPKDKNKIYSLHEPEVQCIAKGKEHKQYEFGNKSSIVLTETEIIVGAMAFEGNPYDGDTLAPQIEQVERITDQRPGKVITDRGYRGRKNIGGTEILIPGQAKPKNQYQKNKLRKRFQRRAAIEPIISHLKFDHRMWRNYLKGTVGDFINTVLAATAFNLKRLLNRLKSRYIKFENYFYDFLSDLFLKIFLPLNFI